MGDARDEERGAPHEPVPGAHLVRVGLYFYAAVMAAALIWRVGFYGESIFFATAADRAAGASPVQDLALGLLVGAAIVIVSFFSVVYTDWGSALAREMAATIGPLGTPNALLLAFASGLAEEMFFAVRFSPGLAWSRRVFFLRVFTLFPDMRSCLGLHLQGLRASSWAAFLPGRATSSRR